MSKPVGEFRCHVYTIFRYIFDEKFSSTKLSSLFILFKFLIFLKRFNRLIKILCFVK